MDVFDFLTLLGGLALFLFGMNVMGDGLEKQAGSKLKSIMEKLTASPIRGFLLGLSVTAVIQSSSATTVMVVGFVNSGLMKLSQAIGIIMGANVGTTVTAWILTLTGIQGDGFLISMLKPSSFSPILAVIGIGLLMFSKKSKKQAIGSILVGFAVLMFGMETMSDAVAPLSEVPEFTEILLMFSNPILGVLLGAVVTGIIQSSSASVGILQALSATGSVTYGTAIPVIMGQNIGTCVTALLSSINANRSAKRVALVHLYFNIIGTVLFLSLFYLIDAFVDFSFVQDDINSLGIAAIHTAFNLLSTAVMLPFAKGLEKLAYLTIPRKEEPETVEMVDERLLATPAVAISQCKTLTGKMAELARDTLLASLRMLEHYDEKTAEEIQMNEQSIDQYEDKLCTVLVKLSGNSLADQDSRTVSVLLHVIGDFERIGDHAINLLDSAKEIHEKNMMFSENGRRELGVMSRAVEEIISLSTKAFEQGDLSLAAQVEPLEQVVDALRVEIKNRHVERLRTGECTIESGFVLSDIISNFERVADHCSNIAVAILETRTGNFDMHGYLSGIDNSAAFRDEYRGYRMKYALPEISERQTTEDGEG